MYAKHNKPKLAALYQALGLDYAFVRANGSYVYDAQDRGYLDLVGGFGAALLGHNPPALVHSLTQDLLDGVPAFVQASVRQDAARLGARLNELLARERGSVNNPSGYYVNLSNSGAEAVEAAVKHAYKVRLDQVGREYERLTRVLNDLYHRIEEEGLEVDLPGAQQALNKFRDDLDEHNLAQFEAMQQGPVMVALKGSYHGKTASALKVTFNKTYRESFEGLSALRPVFIDPAHPERLAEVAAEHYSEFYYPLLEGNKVVLRPVRMSRVIAFIMEPILGEGGIQTVPDATLERLAELHGQLQVPYIIDEIQTGCGRTGRVYAFTGTPLGAIEPEYVLLGKALGGGLVKVGGTLIRRDIYDQDFGILHTSTFGEDELSCRVALAFLDQLDANQGAVLKRVDSLGALLRERLEGLQRRFPGVVAEVRGRGLMCGLALTPLQDASPFFRAAGHQGVLSLLIASYLMAYHRIRLVAPLSTMLKGNPGKQRLSVLRIQPPATLEEEEIERLIAALAEVFTVIERNNEFCLVGHLSGQRVSAEERADPQSLTAGWPLAQHQGPIDARTGFVAHPTKLEHLVDYYFPSFHHYEWDAQRLRDWWNGLSRFLEPLHTRTSHVRADQFVVENNMVFVPYLADYLGADHAPAVRQEIRDKIQDAVTVSKELGDDNIPTAMVGLGAYTSIVTDNGRALNDYEVPVTTGNAFTAALVLEGIAKAAQERGLDLTDSTVAVVGAGGNIGLVLAQVLARHVGRLHLVGRAATGTQAKQGLFKLRMARRACLQELLRGLRSEDAHAGQYGALARGVVLRLETNGGADLLRGGDDAADLSSAATLRRLESLLLEDDEMDAIRLCTDLDQIGDAQVVVVATNSADPELLRPEHVREDAIVCCASVPSNLSRRFAAPGSGTFAFDGGLARLPEGSSVDFVGMPGNGLAFGCMAETLVLGFEGRNHSFCKGLLRPEHVYQVVDMARRNGFSLGDFQTVGAH